MQIAIGGGNDANVGVVQPGPAQALELPLLEDAQQLGLHRRRHLADFVEEQHAAVGLLDASRLGRDRAGKGAALVAEQLGLEQLIGKRRAVDGDEWPAASRRRVMNEARHDFLAGTRFAGEQHRRFRLRHARGMREHILPLARVADDTPLAGARLELARERRNLCFEAGGVFPRGGVAALGFGEMLVRHRERQVIGHAAREVDVVIRKAPRIAREEEQRSEDRVAKRNGDAQRRTRADAAQELPADRFRRDLAPDVVDDVRLAVEQRLLHGREERRAPEVGVRNLRARHRVDAEGEAVLRPGRQREDVVRQRAFHGVGQLRKYRADVERLRHRVQQADQRIDPVAAAHLGRPNRVVIKRQRNQIANRFQQILVLAGERIRLVRRQPDGALHAHPPPNGADQPRSLSGVGSICRRGRSIANQVPSHFDLAGGGGDVEGDRFGAIQAQHVEAVERNRVVQQNRRARQRSLERGFLRHEPRNAGQKRLGLNHLAVSIMPRPTHARPRIRPWLGRPAIPRQSSRHRGRRRQ